jgi:hypothetical protein
MQCAVLPTHTGTEPCLSASTICSSTQSAVSQAHVLLPGAARAVQWLSNIETVLSTRIWSMLLQPDHLQHIYAEGRALMPYPQAGCPNDAATCGPSNHTKQRHTNADGCFTAPQPLQQQDRTQQATIVLQHALYKTKLTTCRAQSDTCTRARVYTCCRSLRRQPVLQ